MKLKGRKGHYALTQNYIWSLTLASGTELLKPVEFPVIEVSFLIHNEQLSSQLSLCKWRDLEHDQDATGHQKDQVSRGLELSAPPTGLWEEEEEVEIK